jgi:hypothetical protein
MIETAKALVVHVMALPAQQQMQSTVAEATPLGGEPPKAEPHGGVAGATAVVAHR